MKKIMYHGVEDGGKDAKGYIGAKYYLARALPLSKPGDIVVLHPELSDEINHVLQHCERIGLSSSSSFVFAKSLAEAVAQIQESIKYKLCVSIFGPQAHAIRPDKDRFDITQVMNRKNKAYGMYKALDIKTPTAICFRNRAHFEESGMTKLPFDITFYKNGGESFGSGIGVRRCDSWEKLLQAISEFPTEQSFQFQEGKQNRDGSRGVSMCSIYDTDEYGRPIRLLSSEQLLVGGTAHSGNIFPSVCESEALWSVTDGLFSEMVFKGYVGHCGFDVLGVDSSGTMEWWLIECNPRWQGSSYPAMLSRLFEVKAWSAKIYKTRFHTLKNLALGELEFNPKTKQGVIIFSFGVILVGKIGLMICGEADYRAWVEKELEKIL